MVTLHWTFPSKYLDPKPHADTDMTTLSLVCPIIGCNNGLKHVHWRWGRSSQVPQLTRGSGNLTWGEATLAPNSLRHRSESRWVEGGCYYCDTTYRCAGIFLSCVIRLVLPGTWWPESGLQCVKICQRQISTSPILTSHKNTQIVTTSPFAQWTFTHKRLSEPTSAINSTTPCRLSV